MTKRAGKVIAASNLRLAGFTTAERAAFRKQFGAGGAVNRAIDTATAEERRVCRVHNRIDVQRGDVAAEDFNFAPIVTLTNGLVAGATPDWSVDIDFRALLAPFLPLLRQPINLPRSRSPAACNESDRAADSAGPAKIPLCLVSAGNRPSAAAMESVCCESARSSPPCRASSTRRASIDFALARGPGAQLASDRTRMKISLRFFTRGLFHFSADTNLPVEFNPVKPKRCVRIRVELFPFGAVVIRKEDEAVLIETLQENDSHRRSRVATRRRKAHRVDITNAGLDRGGEPIRKLPDRIRIQIAPAQTFPDVIVT